MLFRRLDLRTGVTRWKMWMELCMYVVFILYDHRELKEERNRGNWSGKIG